VKYTVVVLAGSRPGRDALAAAFGQELKALIPVAGEPMVRRPVRALLDSRSIEKVMVLAQQPQRIAQALPDDPRLSVQSSNGTIAATMLELCRDPATPWPLLVTTADQALLEPATVEEFCRAAAGADLAVGVVERANMLRRFPEAKRTWLKFRGGAYTGANLFMLASPKVTGAIEFWASAENQRKKGWRVIALLGPIVLIGTALRLLSIDQVLGRLGRKLGLTVRAVRLSNPLAGIDVDKLADHELVEAIIAGRA
jgi:GTP:adenosylcobinamide-phosphate guanylyltransferase